MTTINDNLVLNIVPVDFSSETVWIGRTPFVDRPGYRAIRDLHWRTHAFRQDNRTNVIENMAVVAGVEPIGEVTEVPIQGYLSLTARAIQHATLVWIADRLPIQTSGKQLTFWGQAERARLLSQVLANQHLAPVEGLEVSLRYTLDCRIFSGFNEYRYLGLTIGVDTTNQVEVPVGELHRRGMRLIGREVCRRRHFEHEFLQPNLETLGRVIAVEGKRLRLADAIDVELVDADAVMLRPTLTNLHEVITLCFGQRAGRVLKELNTLRQRMASSAGKLVELRNTLRTLQHRQLIIGRDVEVIFGDFLTPSDSRFPKPITTPSPTLLFGPQGRNTEPYADLGIKKHGPYRYTFHTRNNPTIGVICERQYEGRVDEFVKMLRDGYPDELWQGKQNPFVGGLVRKFQLSGAQIVIESCENDSAESYHAAAIRLLQRHQTRPLDLALVQVKQEHKELFGDQSPYYVTKAVFMMAGIPTQSVRIQVIEQTDSSVAYILNNLALACYAKLGGTPWVLATREPATHEIVIGIGSAEIAQQRRDERKRYFGITTMFQGDGRYLVWDLTREAVFEEYTKALIESLGTALQHVRADNRWQSGDKVRLICHAYKRLRNCEVDAIKHVVRMLLDEQFDVKFAFLDISQFHPYFLFDLGQPGVPSKSGYLKGQGFPARGLTLQLDDRRALIQLTGPNDVKTDSHGLPQPLLIELHSDSDFADLTYLVRQVYHFTHMSWRTFFLATEPITILYSHRIADLLGHLNAVSDWSGATVVLNNLRGRRWFL